MVGFHQAGDGLFLVNLLFVSLRDKKKQVFYFCLVSHLPRLVKDDLGPFKRNKKRLTVSMVLLSYRLQKKVEFSEHLILEYAKKARVILS